MNKSSSMFLVLVIISFIVSMLKLAYDIGNYSADTMHSDTVLFVIAYGFARILEEKSKEVK